MQPHEPSIRFNASRASLDSSAFGVSEDDIAPINRSVARTKSAVTIYFLRFLTVFLTCGGGISSTIS